MNYLDPEVASIALLISDLETIFVSSRNDLRPTLSMPYNINNWDIVKYIWGRDALLDTQKLHLGDKVFYGVVVKSKATNKIIIAIRGTESILEWIEDAEFLLVDHPLSGGKVEAGFYSVYQSLTVEDTPILEWVRDNTNATNTLIISGHSLGAAVSTYLAAEIAADKDIKAASSLKSIASPKTGDSKFVDWCGTVLNSASRVYNYEKDIVPDLPPGDDYKQLDSLIVEYLSMYHNSLGIPDNVIANHMATTYAYLLDENLIDWKTLPAVSKLLGTKPTLKIIEEVATTILGWLINKIRC